MLWLVGSDELKNRYIGKTIILLVLNTDDTIYNHSNIQKFISDIILFVCLTLSGKANSFRIDEFNPTNAEATLVQTTRTQRFLKNV